MKKLFEQKFFILTLLLCVGIVVKMHFDNTSVNTIYGVADTKETVVTTRYPVVIKKIHVFPGQRVYRGDLLLETENHELGLQILKLQSELSALNSKNLFNKAMNEHLDSVTIAADKKYAYTNPLRYQIASLQKQIEVLEKEQSNLNIYAETDSVVGVVNVRQGERLAAFAPFLTLIKNTPLFVRGYIHEYVNTKTFRHQKVSLRSFSRPREAVEASVVEIGDRIVQYPVQLTRSDAPLYGREVIISLPKENAFLVGEKLLIQLHNEQLIIDDPQFDRSLLISKQAAAKKAKELAL
jgi:multidrug resistance efflux pump